MDALAACRSDETDKVAALLEKAREEKAEAVRVSREEVWATANAERDVAIRACEERVRNTARLKLEQPRLSEHRLDLQFDVEYLSRLQVQPESYDVYPRSSLSEILRAVFIFA